MGISTTVYQVAPKISTLVNDADLDLSGSGFGFIGDLTGDVTGDVVGNLTGDMAAVVATAGTTKTAYSKAAEQTATVDWPTGGKVIGIIKRPFTISPNSIVTVSCNMKQAAPAGPSSYLDVYYIRSSPPALDSQVAAAAIAAAPYASAGLRLTATNDVYTAKSGPTTVPFEAQYMILFASISGGGTTVYVKDIVISYDEGTPEGPGQPWGGCS